jgi:hypothetical protein
MVYIYLVEKISAVYDSHVRFGTKMSPILTKEPVVTPVNVQTIHYLKGKGPINMSKTTSKIKHDDLKVTNKTLDDVNKIYRLSIQLHCNAFK